MAAELQLLVVHSVVHSDTPIAPAGVELGHLSLGGELNGGYKLKLSYLICSLVTQLPTFTVL